MDEAKGKAAKSRFMGQEAEGVMISLITHEVDGRSRVR